MKCEGDIFDFYLWNIMFNQNLRYALYGISYTFLKTFDFVSNLAKYSANQWGLFVINVLVSNISSKWSNKWFIVITKANKYQYIILS